MTPARATIPAAADGPAPPLSVGGLFIETLARRDFAALANSVDPSVRSLFGGPDGLEVAVATVGEVGPACTCAGGSASGRRGHPARSASCSSTSSPTAGTASAPRTCSAPASSNSPAPGSPNQGGCHARKGSDQSHHGLEDPEKVRVAFPVTVGRRPALMFLAREAVRLAANGVATDVACVGYPPIPELFERYEHAGEHSWPAPSASTQSRSTRATCCSTPRSSAPS